jgi:muramoyltetrapeptide carboxypeptidase
LEQHGFLAGRDDDRLADLNDAFRDPGVRAVVAILGGAGAYRIVDGIDFAAVRADPKPVVGFSHITHPHVASWAQTGLSNVHRWVGTGGRTDASARRGYRDGCRFGAVGLPCATPVERSELSADYSAAGSPVSGSAATG